MSPDPTTNTEQFEWQIKQLLARLGYSGIQRIGGDDGIASFFAERETPLGRDSIFVVLDFWRNERVGRRQVEQAAGRALVEPARRLVVLTTGRFDEPARQYGRRVGVTLIAGDQLAELLRQADAGAGATTAFQAAAAVPLSAVTEARAVEGEPPAPAQTAVAEPPTGTPPTPTTPRPATETGPAEPRRRSTRVQERVLQRRTLSLAGALGVVAIILVAVLLLTALILRGDSDPTRATERTEPGTEVTVEPLAGGTTVRVAGRTAPGQEVALYRNDLFVNRVVADLQGAFEFSLVPLAFDAPNTLTLYQVTPDGRQGQLLWRRTGVTAPFGAATPAP